MVKQSYRRRFWLVVLLVLLVMGGWAWYRANHRPTTVSKQNQSVGHSTPSNTSSTNPSAFNKQQYSLTDPNSIWVIVNKGRVLPSTFQPTDLTVPNVPLRLAASAEEMHISRRMEPAFDALFAAAQQAGVPLRLASGFRSYQFQVNLYNGYVKTQGQAAADASSARPGHSEHQTGLAADVEPLDRSCEVEQCFDSTPAGKWLAANAYTFGFIIRYQKGKENLTGYEYEPWHIRYVGTDLAKQIHQSNQTLEQFFSLPVFTDYPANSTQLSP